MATQKWIMNKISIGTFDPSDGHDLVEYPWADDKFLGLLIPARAKQQRGFLSQSGSGLDGIAQNSFRKHGDHWLVRFEAGDMFLMPDLVGAHYIHELLSHPEKQFSASDLRRIHNRYQSPQDAERRQRTCSPDELSEMTSTPDAGKIFDEKALQNYKWRLAEIRDEIDEAKFIGDESDCIRLEEEHERICAHVRAATKPGGAVKRLQSQVKRDRDAVRKAIDRAIADITQKNRSLGRHLDNSIHMEPLFQYLPEHERTWDT